MFKKYQIFPHTFDVHIESKSNLARWNNTQSSYSNRMVLQLTLYWLILNYFVRSQVKMNKTQKCWPASTAQIIMACAPQHDYISSWPQSLSSPELCLCGGATAWPPLPLGAAPLPLPRQHFCVTPESAPTQESDTCMGVTAASPPACWSMRQFPASGARRGRGGTPAPLLSLILSGKSNGPLQQQPLRTNTVWLWSCFLMHYNHSE